MELVQSDKARGLETPVWTEYQKLINEAESKEVSFTLGCDLNGPIVLTGAIV